MRFASVRSRSRIERLRYGRAVSEPKDPTPPPESNRLVGGRYRLGEVIGIGGMATVHRALDTRTGRSVAIKLLRREVIEDTEIAMRFRREALAATVLRHPNIVACLEAGTDDGQPFLVMDLIEGEDLAARLRRVGRLAPAEAARVGLDIARALGVAHVRGIVHRDVKPGNILLARDGRALVTDFGIARLAADAEGSVPGTTLGSVHYFSPEQARGATTTAASDVYGLGLVLYEALTGERAWSGETTAALATVRIDADPPSPRALRPEVPASLDAIVIRALDPDSTRRYPNGNVLAAALEPIVLRPAPAAPPPPIAASAAPPDVARRPTVPGPPRRTPKTGRYTMPVPGAAAIRAAPPSIAAPFLVLVAVAIIVGGALFVATRVSDPEAGVIAQSTRTPRPATVEPNEPETPIPTADPTATPEPTPEPTPTPRPTPRPPRAGSLDLCDPILGFACALDASRYDPSRFEPALRFDLADGWATSVWDVDRVVLERSEGALTFASGIATTFPAGQPAAAPSTAQGLVEAFIETDGVAADPPTSKRVAKRRTRTVDLATTGPDGVALFGSSSEVYTLEPFTTTRVIVIQSKDGLVVVTIEPTADSTLESLLPFALEVVDSLRFR